MKWSIIVVLAASAYAQTSIGSAPIARAFTDSAPGQVMIYAGGYLPIGAKAVSISVYDSDFGQGPHYFTPLLLESIAGAFFIRGIGTSYRISPMALAQSFPFGLQAGSDIANTSSFAFGFAEMNGQEASSRSVDGDTPGNLDWVFTPSILPVALVPGAAFGLGGHPLNNPALGGYNRNRTYSAQLLIAPTSTTINVPCGDAEVPSGSMDGSNAVFFLACTPTPPESLILTRALVLRQGADYILTGKTITFCQTCVPQPGDILQAWYRH